MRYNDVYRSATYKQHICDSDLCLLHVFWRFYFEMQKSVLFFLISSWLSSRFWFGNSTVLNLHFPQPSSYSSKQRVLIIFWSTANRWKTFNRSLHLSTSYIPAFPHSLGCSSQKHWPLMIVQQHLSIVNESVLVGRHRKAIVLPWISDHLYSQADGTQRLC